jgi:hypothetical protein
LGGGWIGRVGLRAAPSSSWRRLVGLVGFGGYEEGHLEPFPGTARSSTCSNPAGCLPTSNTWRPRPIACTRLLRVDVDLRRADIEVAGERADDLHRHAALGEHRAERMPERVGGAAILPDAGGRGVPCDDVADRPRTDRLSGTADRRERRLTNSASVAAAERAPYHLLSASCAAVSRVKLLRTVVS